MDDRIKELEAKIERLVAFNQSKIENVHNILLSVNKNFDSVGQSMAKIDLRFDKIDKDLDIINKKIDNLDGSTSENFSHVGIKLDDLSEKISEINMATGFDDLFQNSKLIKP
jgi:hypothetical protein